MNLPIPCGCARDKFCPSSVCLCLCLCLSTTVYVCIRKTHLNRSESKNSGAFFYFFYFRDYLVNIRVTDPCGGSSISSSEWPVTNSLHLPHQFTTLGEQV